MKPIKPRLNITMLLLIAVAINANAQPEPGRRASKEQMVAQRLEKLDAVLKLSTDQKAKIKTILAEEMTTIDKNMIARHKEDKTQRFEQMKAEMDKIRAAANTKIKAVLTEKQQTAYTKFLAEEEKKRPGENGQHKPPASN